MSVMSDEVISDFFMMTDFEEIENNVVDFDVFLTRKRKSLHFFLQLFLLQLFLLFLPSFF